MPCGRGIREVGFREQPLLEFPLGTEVDREREFADSTGTMLKTFRGEMCDFSNQPPGEWCTPMETGES